MADSATSSAIEQFIWSSDQLDFSSLSIKAKATSISCGIADLPHELLLLILEMTFVDAGFLLGRGLPSSSNFFAYGSLARLRMVCGTWNQLIIPILYRKISILSASVLVKVTEALQCRGHLVRHLIIRIPVLYSDNSKTEASASIERSISPCVALEVLDCQGAHHTFTRRNWLHETAPGLALTLKTLVFIPQQISDLSFALLGLGRTIESVDIKNWYIRKKFKDMPSSSFHLPSSMPHLSSVTIRGGQPRLDLLKKLFSRIKTGKKVGLRSRPTTSDEIPLRKLSLLRVSTLNGAAVLDILNLNNIGAHLTSLELHFFEIELHVSTFLIPIVKACPSLLEFICHSYVPKDIFEHLPRQLRRLFIPLNLMSAKSISVIDVLDFVQSTHSNCLEQLTVLVTLFNYRSVTLARNPDMVMLKAACSNEGVDLMIRSN